MVSTIVVSLVDFVDKIIIASPLTFVGVSYMKYSVNPLDRNVFLAIVPLSKPDLFLGNFSKDRSISASFHHILVADNGKVAERLVSLAKLFAESRFQHSSVTTEFVVFINF